jgi:hypothetical protein
MLTKILPGFESNYYQLKNVVAAIKMLPSTASGILSINMNVPGIKSRKINLNNLVQGTYILNIRSISGELSDKLVIKK